MSRYATVRRAFAAISLALALHGQPASSWRRVANSAVDLSLADLSTGPVDRVWYTPDGLLIQTANGRALLTKDFEAWQPAGPNTERTQIDPAATSAVPPEPGARLIGTRRQPARVYALGRSAWRSDDGGLNWRNLTLAKTGPIFGEDLRDLAVSPEDPDDLTVAARTGVWHSVDGGLTWSGVNAALPNLSVRRIYSLPDGSRPLRVEATGVPGIIEWVSGEKTAWRRSAPPLTAADPALQQTLLRDILSGRFRLRVSAAVASGEYVYAGLENGRLAASPDLMGSWRWSTVNLPGPVSAIATDPADGAMAIATSSAAEGSRVWRTLNGGLVWDDITADLPSAAVYGVAFDRAAGTVYLATANGLFATDTDLRARAPETPWRRLEAGLPADAAVTDVKLNNSSTQLYIAVDGWGVYAARAPHRRRDPRLVSAADQSVRAAAPGSLLSVVGAGARAARAGDTNIPVLSSTDDEAQIQIPFNVSGDQLQIALASGTARWSLRVPLEATSPAIFLDGDGAPVLIDADTGLVVDARTALKPGARIQVMAAGLGRVRPEWPAGVPAPLSNAPRVVAPVRVVLDRTPLEPLRATLAPGYVGLYLVEFQVPAVVNAGAVELYLEAGDRQSNRSRLFLEP